MITCIWVQAVSSLALYHLQTPLKMRFKESECQPLVGTGNDGMDDDTSEDVPSDFGYDIILPTAASMTDDEIAPFSNYGRHSVLLAAPGTSIVSTVPNGRYFLYAVRTTDLTSLPG